MITRDELRDWLDNLQAAWISKDAKELITIFSSTKELYENPFDKPLETSEDIMKYWERVQNWGTKRLDFHIMGIDGDSAVVHWILDCDKGLFSGVYGLKFNIKKECSYLRQWYMKR